MTQNTSNKGLKIAIVGATGAVGRELRSILEQRKFPVREILFFSSARSEGKEIQFAGKTYKCQVMKPGCFNGVEIAFFDASDAVSKEWVPQAAEAGAWVVDNSATFRMEDDVLLLVPEVNGDLLEKKLREAKSGKLPARQRILAGPNCSTVQMVVALKPISDRWGLKRVVVSTYQSTSGAGAAAMEELTSQTAAALAGKPTPPKAFTHQIAFNAIPHIGGFKDDGYTSEEQKMILESRKILGLPELKITATAVRVPTYSCHSESINVECERPIPKLDDVYAALKSQAGLVLQDEPKRNVYPMANPGAQSPVEAGTGRDPVYVGRVRKDFSLNNGENGLNLWVVSDNLRKGAALNAVQIGEVLVRNLY